MWRKHWPICSIKHYQFNVFSMNAPSVIKTHVIKNHAQDQTLLSTFYCSSKHKVCLYLSFNKDSNPHCL